MSTILRWLDRNTRLMAILYLFWALFWTLNGADKFFNGPSAPNRAATKSVLVDAQGQVAYTQHMVEPSGFYGVTRDNKMVGYFKRLKMPAVVAVGSLYFFAAAEILLGIGFGLLFLWYWLPRRLRTRETGLWALLTDRVLHRLCFKGGIFVFLVFSTGDILFGDRMELWEHGTFLILTIVTYDAWYRTDRFVETRERNAVYEDPEAAGAG